MWFRAQSAVWSLRGLLGPIPRSSPQFFLHFSSQFSPRSSSYSRCSLFPVAVHLSVVCGFRWGADDICEASAESGDRGADVSD